MKNQSANNKSGFTLIELLVVATIMIVLMAIGIVSYTNTSKNARDSKRKADLETVRQALVLYRSDNGAYPDTSDTYSAITSALVSANYLANPVPQDPKNVSPNVYYFTGTTVSFCLCSQLEKVSAGNYANTSCGSSGTTYYCVTNP